MVLFCLFDCKHKNFCTFVAQTEIKMKNIKKKVKIKDVVKYLLMLALAGFLLYFAFRDISWNDFVAGLRSCNYWWILLSMIISWIVVILRGWRWRLMMRPLSKEITRLEAYDAYNICYLANLVLPRSGEVVRCGMIANSGKATFEGALGTVVLERTWDLMCVVIVTLPLFFFGTFKSFIIENMWHPFVESLPFRAVWLVVALILFIAAIVLIFRVYRKKIAATRFGAKVIKVWKGLVEGIKAGFRMENKWAFFGYSALIWLGYWAMSMFTLYAFPVSAGLNLWDALFLMVVGSLGWIVPVQGGFGAYHFIVAMTLVPVYGFTQSDGLIFATISHESQVVQMLICGIISLITYAIYSKKYKKPLQLSGNENCH